MPADKYPLDPRLAAEAIRLGRLRLSRVLLMNRRDVPWYILVPDVAEQEICDISMIGQAILYDEINRLSKFVRGLDRVEKLNIAAIGNIVPQLHIHIVGRRRDDFAWPGVVWGAAPGPAYSDAEIVAARTALVAALDEEIRLD